jgi:phytoene synthase
MTELDRSYRRCRRLTTAHGTTYYWAAMLLAPERRRHVWALYAFARHADDIVDDIADGLDDQLVGQRERALDDLAARLFDGLERGRSDDPLLAAVVNTTRVLDIDPDCFRRFLRSMAMDLTVDGYDTWSDLLDYMDGSAAVIGEMMLPILDPSTTRAVAPARDLGLAFQLTNFLRDVAEDLERGRIYLPREDLDRFDADPRRGRVDDSWRALMRFEIERNRRLYESADAGIPMLSGRSASCVRTARRLYSQILDRIEDADYDVFSGRVRVPTWRKIAMAASSLAAPEQRDGRLAAGTTR